MKRESLVLMTSSLGTWEMEVWSKISWSKQTTLTYCSWWEHKERMMKLPRNPGCISVHIVQVLCNQKLELFHRYWFCFEEAKWHLLIACTMINRNLISIIKLQYKPVGFCVCRKKPLGLSCLREELTWFSQFPPSGKFVETLEKQCK